MATMLLKTQVYKWKTSWWHTRSKVVTDQKEVIKELTEKFSPTKLCIAAVCFMVSDIVFPLASYITVTNIQETSLPSHALQPLTFLDVYLNCVRGSQINWPAYIPRIQPYTNGIVARTTQLWLCGLVNTCRISSFTSLAVDVECISQIRRVPSQANHHKDVVHSPNSLQLLSNHCKSC